MNKDLKLFYLSNLSNTLGNLVYPLITYILLNMLHIDEDYIGAATMIITLSRIPGIMLGGQLGDNRKCRVTHTAALFQFGSGIFMFLCIFFIHNEFIVILLLCLSKFFSGTSSPLSTKVLSTLSAKDKQSGFANYYWITNLGAAVASLIGGYIFAYSAILIFAIDGITRIVSGVLLLGIRESEHVAEKRVSSAIKIVPYIKSRKNILLYIFFLLVFTFVYSQYSYGIPIKLEEDFINGSSKIYSTILFINGVTVICLTKFLQNFWKNRTEISCLSAAFLFLGLGFGIYIFKLNIIMLVLSTFLWSFGEILFGINELLYISNNVEKEYFARVVSFYDACRNVVIAVAPFLSNLIVSCVNIEASWFVMTALALSAFGALYFFNLSEVRSKAT